MLAIYFIKLVVDITFVMKLHTYTLAVAIMMFHFLCQSMQTAIIKLTGEDFPFNTYELIFVRSIFAIVVLAPFFVTKKIPFLKKKDLPLNFLTAGLSIIASYFWHYGLTTVEMNTATAISFIEPLLVSLLAVIFLKEKISKHNILALLICFLTILVSSNTNILINKGYLLLFSDFILYSFSMILEKKLLIRKEHPAAILFFKASIVCLTSFHVVPNVLHKISLNYNVLLPMLLFSVFYVLETLLIYTAYKIADLSRLQPLIYTKFIFSVVVSYVVLGELLTWKQVLVASIIICTNVNLFFAEKKRLK